MDSREFTAYAKLLLRRLVQLKKLLDDNKVEGAKAMLTEMIEDAQGDTRS